MIRRFSRCHRGCARRPFARLDVCDVQSRGKPQSQISFARNRPFAMGLLARQNMDLPGVPLGFSLNQSERATLQNSAASCPSSGVSTFRTQPTGIDHFLAIAGTTPGSSPYDRCLSHVQAMRRCPSRRKRELLSPSLGFPGGSLDLC